MTEDTNNQGQQATNADPLAQFMPGQSAQPKYTFAGQEFESREQAERWAYEQFERIKNEKDQAAAEAAAAREQAARVAQQQSQFVTGRESATYDHAQALRRFGEDPAALQEIINYTVFGTPKPAVGFGELFKASAAETARLRAEVTAMRLQAAHPEIPWHDPNAVRMIEQARQSSGGDYEGAIARLQVQGALPPPPRWQQQANTVQQQGNFQSQGSTVQAPPSVGRMGGSPSNGMDYNAILAKLNDPNTSLDDGDQLIAALQQHLANNPSAGGQ